MRNLRTLDDLEAVYLREHPDEVDEYIQILLDEFAQDKDISALLTSLCVVSRVKGVTDIAHMQV